MMKPIVVWQYVRIALEGRLRRLRLKGGVSRRVFNAVTAIGLAVCALALGGAGLTQIALLDESSGVERDPAATRVALQLDGGFMLSATGGADGVARVYRDDVLVGTVRGHAAPIDQIAFLDGGKSLLTADASGAVRVTRLDSLAGHDITGAGDIESLLKTKSWSTYGRPVCVGWLSFLRAAAARFPMLTAVVPGAVEPRSKIIVIDPAHGGADTGTVGADGTTEKGIVLATAKVLAAELEKRGYTVYLTRFTDTSVALTKRRVLPSQLHADLMLSIHADRNTDSTVSGAAAYVSTIAGADSLSPRSIKDSPDGVIQWVQPVSGDVTRVYQQLAKEAELKNQFNTPAEPSSPLPADLTLRKNTYLSGQFARRLVARIESVTVLRRGLALGALPLSSLPPEVPSVALELGFLSNPADLAKMQSADWQSNLAGAIADAADDYLSRRLD